MSILILPTEIRNLIFQEAVQPLNEQPSQDSCLALEKAQELAQSIYSFQRLSAVNRLFFQELRPKIEQLAQQMVATIEEIPCKGHMITLCLSRGHYLRTLFAYFYFSPALLQKEGAEWIDYAAKWNPRGAYSFILSLARAENIYHLKVNHEPTLQKLDHIKEQLESEQASSTLPSEKKRLTTALVSYAQIQDVLQTNYQKTDRTDCRKAQVRTPIPGWTRI